MTEPTCPDCAVAVGSVHENGCDVARCMATGRQQLMCAGGCGGQCGQDVWTGEWPGVAECREFGWWARYVEGQPGWVRCSPDAPDAREDLNRLATDANWDASQRRWELL